MNTHAITAGQRWFPFKNNSAEEIPPWSWVALSSAARTAEDAGYLVYANGDKPAATDVFYALTGPQNTPVGKYGECTTDFPAWMAYDTGTPAFGEYFGPSPGVWVGRKGGPYFVLGAVISDETPKRVLIAKIGGVLKGKTDAAITKGNTGTISVYHDGTDAGWNVTAKAELGSVAITKWVYLTLFPWGYEITNAEC